MAENFGLVGKMAYICNTFPPETIYHIHVRRYFYAVLTAISAHDICRRFPMRTVSHLCVQLFLGGNIGKLTASFIPKFSSAMPRNDEIRVDVKYSIVIPAPAGATAAQESTTKYNARRKPGRKPPLSTYLDGVVADLKTYLSDMRKRAGKDVK